MPSQLDTSAAALLDQSLKSTWVPAVRTQTVFARPSAPWRDWRGRYSVRRITRRGMMCSARDSTTISSREVSASRHVALRVRERQHIQAMPSRTSSRTESTLGQPGGRWPPPGVAGMVSAIGAARRRSKRIQPSASDHHSSWKRTSNRPGGPVTATARHDLPAWSSTAAMSLNGIRTRTPGVGNVRTHSPTPC
ncbi:MAG TPA: hypothetical protein VNV62_14660 [Trebonia sp.]|nr:hypothetical protein [Trebonia sp.]